MDFVVHVHFDGIILIGSCFESIAEPCGSERGRVLFGTMGNQLCFPLFRPVVNINTGNTGILYYFTGYAGYISSALVSYLISFLPGAQCIIGHTYYAKHR